MSTGSTSCCGSATPRRAPAMWGQRGCSQARSAAQLRLEQDLHADRGQDVDVDRRLDDREVDGAVELADHAELALQRDAQVQLHAESRARPISWQHRPRNHRSRASSPAPRSEREGAEVPDGRGSARARGSGACAPYSETTTPHLRTALPLAAALVGCSPGRRLPRLVHQGVIHPGTTAQAASASPRRGSVGSRCWSGPPRGPIDAGCSGPRRASRSEGGIRPSS